MEKTRFTPDQIDYYPEYDSEFYRSNNPDLGSLGHEALYIHWRQHGIREGRSASSIAFRESFVNVIKTYGTVLEIGPFYRPLLTGPHISYFDVLDTLALIERAGKIGLPVDSVPKIDWVSPNGDLSIVNRIFDAAASAHCIEHQPDLVKHLQDVANLLTANGIYFLVIPDKRYCFDHYIPESKVSSILQARGSQRHSLESVIEHRSLVTHNCAGRHWAGDHHDYGLLYTIHSKIMAAISEYKSSDRYIDVHAWQFTPDSFGDVILQLSNAGIIPFTAVRIYQTPLNRQEFCAILVKAN
ncbi:hypothetical protein [Methylobacterium sp. 10]|uniref:hypothetical protein n=1 Tax=Methylobacterium sp. 10 TaxID=1101191 RepID=UPI001FDAC00F|nr:hypothetical protein [Methylobacterium sp. 10]